MKKIDVFSHIFTKDYSKKFMALVPEVSKTIEFERPAMVDLAVRERSMSRFPDVLQIVTMGNVPPERYVSAKDAIELATIGNEEMAELVVTRPNLFCGAVGVIPVEDVDASMKVIDHCICDLGLLGIQLYTTLERESFAEPKYRPIFALMAELDRPIWVHPSGTITPPGSNEVSRRRGMFSQPFESSAPDRGMFSWPYESTRFMLDVVTAGIFAEFPKLKIIIHHAGGMVPHYRERIRTIMPKHEEDYFTYFYTDTALYGNTPGLMSAYDFFGAEHILFGTDSPLGSPLAGSNGSTDRTIMAIEKMDIPDEDKEKIFHGNAMKILSPLLL